MCIVTMVVLMEGALCMMKVKRGDCSAQLNHGETEREVPHLLYAKYAILLVESEVSRLALHFDVWKRMTLKIYFTKSKVLVLK